jgi:hypothetical protein
VTAVGAPAGGEAALDAHAATSVAIATAAAARSSRRRSIATAR